MVVHETQEFILVRDAVCAKPYSSGAIALVFVYSITWVVAPSYDIVGAVEDWISSDLEPEVPALLYIDRRGRVIERAIRLTNHVPSLLQ
jgi:hypothetical protein